MNRDYIIIFYIIGFVLYGLEYYLVKRKGVNKWIVPSSTWIVSFIVALPFSVSFGYFASLMQIVCLVVFEIEEYFQKNNDVEKMKIRNL